MTEPADTATKDAYEGAIRSFTEAEIALQEVVSDLQRFRGASGQLAEAGTSLADARAAVARSAATVDSAAASLAQIASSLASATQTVAALDPERFWASFNRLETTTTTSASEMRQAVDAGFADTAAARKVLMQARTLAAGAFVAAVIAAVAALVILLR